MRWLGLLGLFALGAAVPEKVSEELRRAADAVAAGKPIAAIQIYERLRAQYKGGPAHVQATEALAKLQFDQGRFDKAAANYGYLLRKFPKDERAAAFAEGYAAALYDQGKYTESFRTLLKLAQGQAGSKQLDAAYESLGQVDFSLLGKVPASLAWQICALSAQVAEAKQRLPAAVLAMGNQYVWIRQEPLRPWFLKELRKRIDRLETVEQIDWILLTASRAASAPQGPEQTLPPVTEPRILRMLEERRKQLAKGPERP